MLLSRALARARIARGERPGRAAAWGPVLFDAAAITALLLLLWGGLSGLGLFEGGGLGLVILVAFVLFYIPFQAVIIVSALWAAKSRWLDEG